MEKATRRRREYRALPPDQLRKHKLKTRYGITPQDFDALLAQQGGACALCRTTEPAGRWKQFIVDHCHETGRIRGLLCNKCNAALGVLGDTVEGLRHAIRYLEGR